MFGTRWGDWCGTIWPPASFKKAETDVHFIWNEDNESGEYKLWIAHDVYTYNIGHFPLTDMIGNLNTENQTYTLKIDNFAPNVSSININENSANLFVDDDYSGLSKDYSKIKYAWVKSKSEVPTKWNTVTEENIKPVRYNDENNLLRFQTIVEFPKEKGEWYLCAKIEGYTDIAGNEASSEIVYSKETIKTESNLVIDVKEDEGLNYPTNVHITITSENKKFGISESWYEHKGLNDKIPISANVSTADGTLRNSFQSTVNGPIIIHIIDSFGKEYVKEWHIKNVQETILTFDITDENKELIVINHITEKKFLWYVDWGDDKGNYITENALDLESGEIKEDLFRSIHKYAKSGKKSVSFSGSNFRGFNPCTDMNLKTMRVESNVKARLKKSRNQLIKIEQFGIHKNIGTNWTMVSFYRDCVNLKDFPKENDNSFKAFEDVTNFTHVFAGCKNIETIPKGLFEKAKKATEFDYVFENCVKLELKNEQMPIFASEADKVYFRHTFDKCTNIKEIPYNLFYDTPNAYWLLRNF